MDDSTIRISYDNADRASKAIEANIKAEEQEDDGFENVTVTDEPHIINEGTMNAYTDGGQFIITWS